MTLEMISSLYTAPATEALSQILEIICEVIVASKDVLIEKRIFAELAHYLQRMESIIKELNKKGINHSESLNNAIEIFNREIKVAKQLTLECGKKNKVYLLMNCRSIAKQLENITRELSHALSFIPLASLDLSSGIVEEIKKLCDNMGKAEFKAAIAEEEILEKIEAGIQERSVDRSYANNLLVLIAQTLGISTERSALKKEFEEFKNEIESAHVRKNMAEAIQMDQIIALLGRADAASSPKEKEVRYFTKRNSLGSQPLEPLQSFYCPITRDVMTDPVETSSGQTFERSAIEKWFADGNKLCPLTMTPLDTSILRPNKTLRQSIAEWRDRNTMIRIASIKPKLLSENEEEVFNCLEQLQDLCEQSDLHQEWVVLENYPPTLIKLLGERNRDIRIHALLILCILAKDSDDAKVKIVEVDNSIESIAHSLGRRIDERKLAVALLLELSRSDLARDRIGKVQGCILLVVTMLSSDDNQASRDARELLENLSFSDQNIIQMAKANYFKYLLQRLSSGPEDVKCIMATTLAELELTDPNKSSLLEDGVLGSLLPLVSNGDLPMKTVAIKALKNLATLPKNGLRMIKEGAMPPLLDLLFHHSPAIPSLREQAAATIMHLAISTMSQETEQLQVSLLESDDDIFKLFSLINLSGPDIQKSILRTFFALCQSLSATNVKAKLRQHLSVPVLVQLCELDNPEVRPNAVKLLCCLTDDGDEATILEHVDQRYVETFVKIIKSSTDEDEIGFAMGIISNLPEDPQITRWFLDAGALPFIFNFLHDTKQKGPCKDQLIENAVGAVRRFTVSMNQELQKKAAEAGIIPALVQWLEVGTTMTKKHSAISLAQFSQSSPRLSRPLPKRAGFLCFSAPPESACPVHRGICSVESSFCLLEADAVGPLVRVLAEADPGTSEASFDALLTLIDGELLQSGSKVLAEANAIPLIIRLLGSSSPTLLEKALNAMERIFRQVEFKQKYGASAQMSLVDLTQRGSSSTKSLAARILAHLNVLHEQSSYF